MRLLDRRERADAVEKGRLAAMPLALIHFVRCDREPG
jgi:hypothetical protein